MKQLKNNTNNYLRNICPTDNSKVFWTTKKKFASVLKNPKCKYHKKDDRSKDNFVSFNARAANDYADCESMIYIYNRFMNPNDKQFFTTRIVTVDEDLLAVSDLIQFIFRGCIRNNEPMNCYIPSARMRTLLKNGVSLKFKTEASPSFFAFYIFFMACLHSHFLASYYQLIIFTNEE